MVRLTDDGPDRVPGIEFDYEKANDFMEYLLTESIRRQHSIAKKMRDYFEWVDSCVGETD